MGSGLGDSNGHDFVDIPVVVAGGGQLQPGRRITADVGITAINKRILQVAGVTGPALDAFVAGVTPYANL